MFPESTRILVVDDMTAMRQVVKNQIAAMGLKNILEAENGQVALAVLEAQAAAGKPLELVISDWNMPEMSGVELLRAVRAHTQFKTLPFLMVTAEGDQKLVIEAVKAGVTNYIIKPFTPETLREKLEAVWKKVRPAGS